MDISENTSKSNQFNKTFISFKSKFADLKSNPDLDEVWAEEALTWANILTHRAKLA